MAFTILYVTHPNKEHAEKVIKQLMDKKLIACANTFPITSTYFWKGNIENDDEIVTILKTIKPDEAESAVKKIHEYECPCIMRMELSANKEYEDWIRESFL